MRTKLLIIALLSPFIISVSNACPEIMAVQTVENYTGETYSQGDCEKLELIDSNDETVVQACEILEGV
ncbi:MAG: hypothetical protein ACKOX6_11260 [Bdellovibrio sp.]